jgi:hypothetical protein
MANKGGLGYSYHILSTGHVYGNINDNDIYKKREEKGK